MRKFLLQWFRNAPIVMRSMNYFYAMMVGILYGALVTHWQLKVMSARDLFCASVAFVIMLGLHFIVMVTVGTFSDRLGRCLRLSPRSAPMKIAAPQPPDPEAEAELERLKARVRESWVRLNDPQYEEMTVRAPIDQTPNAPGGDC